MIEIISNLYPRQGFPSFGIFVEDHARVIQNLMNVEVSVLNTMFPGINSVWKMNGAIPKVSEFPVRTLPILTLPKFKFPELMAHLFARKYRQRIKKYGKPDLVIIHYWYPAALITPVLIEEDIPYILHAHGTDLSLHLKSNSKLSPYYYEYARHASKLFFSGGDIFDLFTSKYPDLSSKCRLFPNPIVYLGSKSVAVTNKNKRKKILTISNLTHEKAIDQLLDVASEMQECDFTIIGMKPVSNYAANQFKRIENLTNVTFLQSMSRDKLHEYIKNSDVYFHPSRVEPFGMAVAEAILGGLPIYARKVGVLQHLEFSEQLTFFNDIPTSTELKKIVEIPKFTDDSSTMTDLEKRFGQTAVSQNYQNLFNEMGF